MDFADQFVFRPTGSVTATIAIILNNLSSISQEQPYVHLIALNFNKAFDTVRHATLMEKMAALLLPDCVLRIVDYLSGQSHCTFFRDTLSDPLPINTSVVQGSALGPVAFITIVSSPQCMTPGNVAVKYADDNYLIVPSKNSIPSEHLRIFHPRRKLTI